MKMKSHHSFVFILLFLSVILSQQVFENDQVLELITNAGYRGEAYLAETEDGYYVKIHRIVPKFYNGKKPVLLMHGILATSADFLITGPEIALAYLLSDQGFDVWMGNSRGSKHSTKHRKFTQDSREYWRFSWHEIGFFDIAAMIDYVLRQTEAQNCFFIGFSQGTTSLLVLLSSRPQYNHKITQAHLLAPPAFRKKLPKSRFVFYFLNFLDRHPEFRFLELRRLLKIGEKIGNTICRDNDLFVFKLCKKLIRTAFGGDDSKELEIETKILPHLIKYLSTRVSVMQLSHYYQNMVDNKFRQFDHKDRNYEYYNTSTPPEYELSNVIAPVYLYHAAHDKFITEEGAAHLRSLLPNVKLYRIINDWNHIDFVYSKYSREILYRDISHSLATS